MTLDRFMAALESQDGDRYEFGAEAAASDTDPAAFDCSELVQWAAAQAEVRPLFPDGSWIQARAVAAAGLLVPVATAVATRGALLFRFSSNPFEGGRPAQAHVAVSRGDGTTIEARSTRHGVGMFTAAGRGWTHAGLIPGIGYHEGAPMEYLQARLDRLSDTRLTELARAGAWRAAGGTSAAAIKAGVAYFRGAPDPADLLSLVTSIDDWTLAQVLARPSGAVADHTHKLSGTVGPAE